uniref:NADH-ubiquinone oxidoreductase chain 3 n=1 Tax=Mellinus arvensis TaxID=1507147 RepID=A0A7L7S130_9HYME|nr:NADH dehydrogenase subunit 3 [Mellinus arvensis]
MSLLSLIIMMLVVIIMLMNFVFMKKYSSDREKMTSFECGFDSITSPRLPFSINYFLISLIFLVFDLEIVLLVPMILSLSNFSIYWLIMVMYFMMLMIVGVYLEWVEMSLNWFV